MHSRSFNQKHFMVISIGPRIRIYIHLIPWSRYAFLNICCRMTTKLIDVQTQKKIVLHPNCRPGGLQTVKYTQTVRKCHKFFYIYTHPVNSKFTIWQKPYCGTNRISACPAINRFCVCIIFNNGFSDQVWKQHLFCIIALLTFVDSFENEFDLKLSSSYEVGVVNTDY